MIISDKAHRAVVAKISVFSIRTELARAPWSMHRAYVRACNPAAKVHSMQPAARERRPFVTAGPQSERTTARATVLRNVLASVPGADFTRSQSLSALLSPNERERETETERQTDRQRQRLLVAWLKVAVHGHNV